MKKDIIIMTYTIKNTYNGLISIHHPSAVPDDPDPLPELPQASESFLTDLVNFITPRDG
jgi:hypothetical protein